MSRQRLDPFDRRSMALSVILHLTVLALGFASTFYEPPEMAFLTYEIELVSPAPALQADEPAPAKEEIVIERPDPEPPPPEPETEEPVPVEDPEPEPAREESPKPVDETPPEVAEEAAVAAAPEPPKETAEVTGEALNVRIEGLRRDYPQYYANIIRQIQRCFRWQQGGNWETTVFFYIEREGGAADIQFVTRSGSTAFDFESMGAVECAGQGRFGPLPEELPYDRFPVRFRFRPAGAPDAPPLEPVNADRGHTPA